MLKYRCASIPQTCMAAHSKKYSRAHKENPNQQRLQSALQGQKKPAYKYTALIRLQKKNKPVNKNVFQKQFKRRYYFCKNFGY